LHRVRAGEWKEGDQIPTDAALAQDYLQQDFAHSTPNEYPMRVASLQGVSYSIEAMLSPAEIHEPLAMPAGELCLVLFRATRSLGMVASVATMCHPASAPRLIFAPRSIARSRSTARTT